MVQVRNHKIIVTLILMGISSVSFSQSRVAEAKPEGYPELRDSTKSAKVRVTTYADLRASVNNYDGNVLSKSVTGVQQDLYVKNFGFFCKKEFQFEKTTRIPIRVRLGSLEQCNRLEQKD